MPELPEVETVRLGLEQALLGKRIEQVRLMRPNLRLPFPKDFEAMLQGRHVTAFERRAKYILARLEGDLIWLSHLGMSGAYRIATHGANLDKHDHVLVNFKGGQSLIFHDPRRFGFMDVFEAKDLPQHKFLGHLGIEPLSADFNVKALLTAFGGRKAPIKNALMDQKLVVGVGNIYASEALYMAGIHPMREAGSLKAREAKALCQAVVAVLEAALKSGGSTLRDHRQLDGNTGYFQHDFKVYGQAGQICPCGMGKSHIIEVLNIGGRSSFYCPVKQR